VGGGGAGETGGGMGLGPFGRPTLGGVDEHTRKRVPDVEDRTEAAVAATHPTVSLPTSPPLLVPMVSARMASV
jgi:hypothetical protein